MDILPTHVQKDGPLYRENHARMTQLVSELRDRVSLARFGGGEKYLQRHREQGKLPARERI
jgi:acetyl-CoA carboxylase carboxyltransferase component